VERGRAERKQRQTAAFRTPSSGTKKKRLERLAMFQFSAFDPLGIAMMGFGVLVVAVLAFVI
jgi:hypothetical protein